MTNTEQPSNIEQRLSRLEVLFANLGETVLGHDANIDVLVANVQQLTENIDGVNQRVDSLAAQAAIDRQQSAIDRQQSAIDRQQVAIDRQQAAIDRQEFRSEILRIWEYLRERNGGSSTPSS
jgi:uncharacterized protein YoxC